MYFLKPWIFYLIGVILSYHAQILLSVFFEFGIYVYSLLKEKAIHKKYKQPQYLFPHKADR